ncbi:galactose-1-epimerase [Lactococcus termiticola]|uniref:Aldose 1-epimerase n=1 Tax=Lactococcus termiticola TaxID=2169526 RepID=A0A2R5HI78_9LACT|nr:galactose-1-epimerase [Lactococcus termiticola]GBG95968.1 aldose 1-epimerase [Lactococcus termiticola]
MKIETNDFGAGTVLIRLTNKSGQSIAFSNLGARVVDWNIDGRQIVLGFDSAQEYLDKDAYPGATIGRTAGRVTNGIIHVDGQDIQLPQNEGEQTLHGGPKSFETKVWDYEIIDDAVKFTLTSPDGDNGYPGNLKVTVIHRFDEAGDWTIEYEAISDKDTVFNPTGHVYFNLAGDASQPIDDHQLKISASRFVPLKDKTELVRGDIVDVTGTDFDLREGLSLKQVFASDDAQIQLVDGFDHPFLLDAPSLSTEQASLSYEDLTISVKTDQPALVIFTANFGDIPTEFRGKKIANHGGITFESQVSPGSELIPELGDISLRAGELYQSQTIYSLRKQEK